jgi:hypothetical protein
VQKTPKAQNQGAEFNTAVLFKREFRSTNELVNIELQLNLLGNEGSDLALNISASLP